MRILVAMILVAVWPAVTSHYLLESLGIIHVAHHETDLTAKNALEHHHQHPHHGEGPSHQDQQHHHQDTGGEGETSADHHIFADGDYAWISAGKALTKPELLVCCSLSLFCASSLSAIEDDLDSPGPAPPGAAPPLLQKTWQFSLRAAVPVRAPSTSS